MTISMRLAIAGLALLGATPLAATPSALPGGEPDGYVHEATGFVFPGAVGEFQLVSEQTFGKKDENIGVGYDVSTPGAEMAVTIFVYAGSPASEAACQRQFDERQVSVKAVHPDARLLERTEIESPSANWPIKGQRALYEMHGNFGGKDQLLRSESILYCRPGGEWLITYRITAPATANYRTKLDAFLQALAWPKPGSGGATKPGAR